MQDVSPEQIYAHIGEAGIAQLTAAFYRQVRTDAILAPMYPQDDLAGSEQRLRDFLLFRFGGPPHYLKARGHPRLRLRHAPFPIDQQARDRWVALMHNALQQTDLSVAVRVALQTFFADVATFLINNQPPDGHRAQGVIG
jgi:hemoglobin